jgi:hypothetical protein
MAWVAGVVRTDLGSYTFAFQGAGILCVVAALAFLGRPRQRETAAATA